MLARMFLGTPGTASCADAPAARVRRGLLHPLAPLPLGCRQNGMTPVTSRGRQYKLVNKHAESLESLASLARPLPPNWQRCSLTVQTAARLAGTKTPRAAGLCSASRQ